MSSTENKEKTNASHKILTVVGIILCLILIPILALNLTLLAKSFTDKESVPNVGGIMPLIVLTDSMYPQIESGDMIICKTLDAEDVCVGDVIAFFDPAGNGSSVVTHRVTEITEKNGELAWVTKGDNNNVEDRLPVPAGDLVAKWTGVRVPNLGSIAIFMQSTAGLVVCVVVPLVLLVAYDVLRRRAYEKKQSKDNDELLAELEELRKLKAEKDGKN